MSKCIAYVAAAVVFFGLGAIISGACVWFLAPREITPTVKKVAETRYAECAFVPNVGNVFGSVRLVQSNSGKDNHLSITANITGLSGGLHGFHIHQWGVPATYHCTACGGHYNPRGLKHGGPDDTERHVGDLGNIDATENAPTLVKMEDKVASLWGDESVVGRAIVIHEGEDDLGTIKNDTGSTKTGNAGSRVACCTIFLVKE